MNDLDIKRAVQMISDASNVVVTSGAGLGVDSGLPDFRGPEGFWSTYPPYKRLGLRFEHLAQPETFASDPTLAWGFYGHRLDLYRKTRPHVGYDILRRLIVSKNSFVVTSNVDGHFMKAGFDAARIYECHGSINLLQCIYSTDDGQLWSAKDVHVDVDKATMRAVGRLPECRSCGGVARPAVLMFMDATWAGSMFSAQLKKYRDWVMSGRSNGKSVVVELGAGTMIPTIRMHSEALVSAHGFNLIRINPFEPELPHGDHVSIDRGALEAMLMINDAM